MRARIVEQQEFERGKDPKDALGLGKCKAFMIIFFDADDDFSCMDEE